MLANLIISSTLEMTSQKDPASVKSTHFAPQLEVFNYTGSKSTNSDDSLLITPNQKEAERLRVIETATFNKPALEEKTKEQQDCQDFQEQAKKKRRDFLRRMTQNTAIFKPEPQQLLSTKAEQPNETINHHLSMEVEEQRNATISIVPLEHSNHEVPQLSEQRHPLPKEVQNPISERKNVSYLSKENQEKIQSFSKLMMSANDKPIDANEVMSKEKIEKMKMERKRVTQDLKTLLNLYVFNQNEELTQSQHRQSHQKPSYDQKQSNGGSKKDREGSEVKISANYNVQNHRRESLIERAISRLSGGKASRVAKRDRVTLETSQIYGILKVSENEKEAWMSKIEAIQEQVEKMEKQPARQLGQKRRQDLKRYLEQTNFRVKSIDEKNHQTNHQNVSIQQALRQQQGFLRYLQQQISKKTAEKAEVIDKTIHTKKMIEPPSRIKALMTPLYYLEDNYNVRIATFEAKKGSSPTSPYVLDFIIDRDIYCRIKRNQAHLPTIFIRPSTAAETSPPQWTIDIRLRIQVLNKYFKLRLQHFQPIEILLYLGRYYEQLEQLENDFQMIEKIYELSELTLNSANDRLSFKLDIHYQMSINVIVNLLNFGSKEFYQLEVIPVQSAQSHEEHLEPLYIEDNGQQSLISFITRGLERILV